MPFFVLLLFIVLGIPAFAQAPSVDLSQIGGGARALGLGLAQTGGSNDLSAVFFNPAGLGNMKTSRYSGMNGTLFQEISYVTGIAAWPVPVGVFGLGYIGAQLPGIPITSRGGSGAGTTVTLEGTSTFTQTQIVLSYGTAISRFLPPAWAGRLRLGGDVRLISEQVPNRLNRTHAEIAYGFQYVISRPVTFGMVWRPTGLSAGIRVFVPQDLYELEVFADILNTYGLPRLVRTGLEWRPVEELAIRAGLNQRFRAGGVESGITGGIGLDLSGMKIEYAYHPVGQFLDNTAHFFSLGFEIGKIIPKQVQVQTVIPAQLIVTPKIIEFSDVPDRFWAGTPIQYVAALGIMEGYSNGTFEPGENVGFADLKNILRRALESPFEISLQPQRYSSLTRREVVRAIVEAVGLRPAKSFNVWFPDIDKRDPYAAYIAVAVDEGFLEYISGEPFEGDRPVTRAEVAEIISKIPVVKVRIKEYIQSSGPER